MTAWPVFFAIYFHDFLAAGAGENGIPAAEDLPMSHQESGATEKSPSLHVSCLQQPSTHPKIFRGEVQIKIRYDIQPGSENTAGPALIAAIEKRLIDDDAHGLFTMAKSEEDRTGWHITIRNVGTATEVTPDDKTDTKVWIIPVALSAIVQREHTA